MSCWTLNCEQPGETDLTRVGKDIRVTVCTDHASQYIELPTWKRAPADD